MFSTHESFGQTHSTGHSTHQYTGHYSDDMDYHGGTRQGAMNNLQPMQRFLQGIDPSPFAPELLHSLSRIKAQRSPNSGRYEAPFPSADLLPYGSRNGSPDTTSAISSQAAQNELHSPHHMHANTFSSPDGYSHGAMSYPSPDASNGAAYPVEHASPGGSITLREIEIHHAPEESELLAEQHEYSRTATTVLETEFVPMADAATVDEHYMLVDKSDYKNYHEDGLHEVMPEAEEVQPISTQSEESDSDYKPNSSKKRRRSTSSRASGKGTNNRRYRKNSNSSTHSPTTTKVTKKSRDAPRFRVKNQNGHTHPDAGPDSSRPFPCPFTPYGCTSDFASKNEWKRHISTQHIKLGFWRCDLCPTTVDPHDADTIYHNDFNRKDLFTQHLRRMHAPSPHSSTQKQKEYPVNDDNVAQHQHRCYQKLRSNPPKATCLFCERGFTGPNAWDECVEHVGRHLEKERNSVAADARTWRHGAFLEEWLEREGLIEREEGGNGGWRLGSGKPLKADDE